MVRTTSDKQISRIFPGQITVFKDYDLCNKSALFKSFLNTLLAKTRHGVIYAFYFFSHYFILLFAITLWKITGYDLQLHLTYRNRIENKETEVRYCSCIKMFLDKVMNFKDFSRPNTAIKYFSITLTEFKYFSRRLVQFKTLLRFYEP